MNRFRLLFPLIALALLLAPVAGYAAPAAPGSPAAQPAAPGEPVKGQDASCALLDDPAARGKMSGMFAAKLLAACGRQNAPGPANSQDLPAGAARPGRAPAVGLDVLVNDPSGDTGGSSHTQSTTSLARSETTGTLCSAYNDSYSDLALGIGFTGFSRSADGGATWSDRGAVPQGGGGQSWGDPSLAWRKADGAFYMTNVHTSGLGLWKSTDDCSTFAWVGMVHTNPDDDKEFLAVDNTLASPTYGRLLVAWTNLTDGRIYSAYSSNAGVSWSAPKALSSNNHDVQGAWPVFAPNGDIYVAWLRWNPYPSGPIDIQVVRSTNGGVSYASVANPLSGGVNPRAAAPTATCAAPALNGEIAYLPAPQIAVTPNGDLHVVYSRDPDGYNSGDVVDVYYRRSTDDGATWGPEVRLNDDGTTRDQFFPTISAGPTGRVMATWYDRRLDPNNLLFDYYLRVSHDGGATWEPSQRVSDVSSPVYIDPELAPCYHGDYDQQIQDAGFGYIAWSDSRNVQGGHPDPDVWFDRQAFASDYTLDVTPASLAVCAPADAVYTANVGSILGYTAPVTLDVSGNPAGTTASFSVNPLTPPGSSTLTIGNTGAAAAGSSILTVSASSASGPQSADVLLDLYTAAPGQPLLASPANGATNIALPPVFTWAASSQAATYSIQVATDAAFATIVDQASGLTDTTYTATAPLTPSTLYYWRVQAGNACSAGAWSAAWSFTTAAAPGACPAGTTARVLFDDGFENGIGGWTLGSGSIGNTWAVAQSNPHSGLRQAHADDPDAVSDQRLVSPPVAIPLGEDPVTLQFWHEPDLEPSGATACYDGGILEVSTDDGATWAQVPDASLLAGPYTGPVPGSFGNPLGGLQAWCGATGYLLTVADVSAYAGETARFRYRLGSDAYVNFPGWDIDDVLVQSCQATACPWDVNDSGFIDIVDIEIVAAAWNTSNPAYDFDGNGLVDAGDVSAVAGRWNTVCGPAAANTSLSIQR